MRCQLSDRRPEVPGSTGFLLLYIARRSTNLLHLPVTLVMPVVGCTLKSATMACQATAPMTSTGVAPASAPTRVIVGPLSTQAGFPYWYLACFPDCVVAVQQSIGAFFVLGMSDSAGRAFGLVGILSNTCCRRAQAFRQRIEAALQSTPSSRLRVKPNVVYQTTQLKAITYKLKRAPPLILSDLVVETKTGSRQRYGIVPADFEKVYPQLKQMYPTQVSSI